MMHMKLVKWKEMIGVQSFDPFRFGKIWIYVFCFDGCILPNWSDKFGRQRVNGIKKKHEHNYQCLSNVHWIQ